MKYIKYLLICCFSGFTFASCTDLSETLYDQVASENYYNTKMDVVRAVFRPFEHGYWSIGPRQMLQEIPADQLGTWGRNGWWIDAGVWSRLHYHTWTPDEGTIRNEWNACYQGIMQANSVIDDLQRLNPGSYDFTQVEFDALASQCRALRAWFYLRLLDTFRNLPLAVSIDVSKNSVGQVSPQEMFEFIESELLACVDLLEAKQGAAGNGVKQGQWSKAGAAALLVRLYLNAEKWIGTPKYDDCALYAQKIIGGDYGFYGLETTWDRVFDWTNESSNEIIFGFPSAAGGYSHWHYGHDTYWCAVPVNIKFYFGTQQQTGYVGDHNSKYALQPSLDVAGNSYNFNMGRPVAKFKKYPNDYRLKLYKNLGNNTREGMFLFGYLEYQDGGVTKRITAPITPAYDLYIRDQVGAFNGLPPGETPSDLTSDHLCGDHNSGWHFCKYPFYSDNESGRLEADYAEIRLAEIYYSLAECKFRSGDVSGAARLLNDVRKRNYPEADHAQYLYQPEGSVVLTEMELIDEWGREFLGEARRRTDIIRWNKFSSEAWWDKQPDADNHTEIFPIPRTTLSANKHLVQNPGYAK